MTDTNIDSAVASDLTSAMVDFVINPESTDGATGNGEFRYQIEDWETNYGYYLKISALQIAIDAKALWTMGAGFTADVPTTLLLSTIKGSGKDSFNSIMSNLIRTYTIAGDSFAEIIRDEDGFLANLKPLDPSTIVIVTNAKGRIIRYEQVTKVNKKKTIAKFQPDEIFHLSRKRIADSVHGISVIPAVQDTIDAREEAIADWRTTLHRNVAPLWIFHLDTDDTSEIASIKTKADNARAKGENMYIPKGIVVPEVVATSPNASYNPMAWIAQLNDDFFQTVNVPQIIVGNAKEFTDASAKIVYLSYEQCVKGEQLYNEEQVLIQLNLEIKLTFPASLQNELVSDTPAAPTETDVVEEEPVESASQPNDTTAEVEGKQ